MKLLVFTRCPHDLALMLFFSFSTNHSWTKFHIAVQHGRRCCYNLSKTKIRQITRPRFAIQKIIANLWIIYVEPIKKDPEIFNSIFDSGSSNLTSIHQFYYSALTQLRSPTFSIRLDDDDNRTPLCQYLSKTRCIIAVRTASCVYFIATNYFF